MAGTTHFNSRRKAQVSQIPSSICWFEVPADDLNRAKKFYQSMFGWKFAKLPAAINDYWHIDTGGPDASPDGGMMPRMHPQQPITNYISIPSVSKAATKVKKLGGTVCKPKTAGPGMGYFAICLNTEGNTFAL
jgi:predicted enzyme related to lactoylglutathione lyase